MDHAFSRILALTLALGCSSNASMGTDASTTPRDSAIGSDGGPTETTAARLERYLTGDFSSRAQSETAPAYFDIRLSVCPVDAPELGERVLYVEQAAASSLDAPYRQRLYVVEAGAEAATAVSRVFELASPGGWVGACSDTSPRRSAAASDAIERAGCDVVLRWDAERSLFVGGTLGESCVSTLNGASYATSEVTLAEDLLESWDRGFDSEGEQVWGATEGPYRFDRLTAAP